MIIRGPSSARTGTAPWQVKTIPKTTSINFARIPQAEMFLRVWLLFM
jgi:hypothetical protein